MMDRHEPLHARRLLIIGGGCFGTLHLTRLLDARARGKLVAERIDVVDRSPSPKAPQDGVQHVAEGWSEFLEAYFAGDPSEDDHIVPACYAPHLMLEALAAQVELACPDVRVERASPEGIDFRLPYRHLAREGTLCFSAAGWVCPARCVEPEVCPAVRAERTWELPEIVTNHDYDPPVDAKVVLWCRHYVSGVAAIPVKEILDGRDRLLEAAQSPSLPSKGLVATVSSCHGVLGILEMSDG